MRHLLLLSTLLMALASPARAQTLADVDRLEAAVYTAWQLTPLTVRKLLFATAMPTGFGQYTERSSNVFTPTQQEIVYIEPIAYGWTNVAKSDLYDYGIVIDIVIKTANGKIVGQYPNFGRTEQQSHSRNLEFWMAVAITLNGISDGDYVLELQLHDLTGNKSTNVDLSFKIAG
jgi:hypothetical protein